MFEERVGRTRIVYAEPRSEIEGSLFITGFKGFGATGLITVHHIVKELKMKRIGYVIPHHMPELVYVDENGVGGVFEIYYSRDHKVLALLNREVPDDKSRLEYTEAIARWVSKLKVRLSILVGGLDKRFREGDEKLRWACTSAYKGPRLSEPTLHEWLYVIGPLASLMLFLEIYNVPSVILLPYSEVFRPDPAAAAVALSTISRLIGVRIDVSELYEESKRMEEELKRMEEVQQAPRGGQMYM